MRVQKHKQRLEGKGTWTHKEVKKPEEREGREEGVERGEGRGGLEVRRGRGAG